MNEYLTVDNIDISVDSIDITVDTLSTSATNTFLLKVPYRFFSNDVDLYLWDEIREKEFVINITPTEEDGFMVLEFYHPFRNDETFEARVISKDNNKQVWRGKILTTTQDDLQNFKSHSEEQNIYKL